MNLLEKLEREKDLMDINNICPISYGLAQQCANLLSDKMNDKFNVFTSSKPNSNEYIFEFYLDDDTQYIDIAFDKTNSASIYYKKRANKNDIDGIKSIYLDKVYLDDLFEIIDGLIELH